MAASDALILPLSLDDSSPPLPRLLPPPGLPPSPDCAELPSSTHDVVLAGLAQLAALRLNTRRCLVSLFDRRRQLVVAEATQDSSLLPDTQTRGQIWLGGVAFPHSFGVCGHMLDRTTPGASMLSAPAAVSVSVVPDLTLDPILGSLPFVTASPLNRFYAGVSLVSSAGITLGMLCVLDDVPRLGLDQTQLDFLHQLSHAVTSHIESSQPAATVRRASKMVRGLGDFFEHWNSSTKRPDDQPDLDGNAEHHGAVPHRPQPVPLQPSARVEEAVQGTSSDEQLGSTADTVVNVSADSTKTIRTLLPEQDPITSDAMAIFGRAAKIIRDSIEVDSVAFLDAHISSFGGLVHDAATTGFKAERQVLAGQTPADDSTSGSTSCPVLGASYASVTAGTKCGPDISERVLLSLVKRYPSGKVFAFDEDGTPILTTDNKRMPESCDITGADDSPDSEQLPTPLASDTSLSECARHGEVAEQSFYTLMSSIFPRARSVALVPLWDAAKEQWYAGCLAWTESPTRSFMLDGEISYLRAFAATIMAEVDHLDAFASERANNALLGSISHELRSPLHGITAALELLQDTKLTPSQVGILRTMNHCGHTLLDVIDHLLDFSKINTLARSGRNRGVGANQARMSKSQDKTGDLSGPKPLRLPVVELDALVEETTDSIFSGLSFGRTLQPGSALGTLDSPCSTRAQSRHHSTRSNSILSTESLMSWASDLSPEESSSAAVSVYLRTAPHVSWLCHVDSGAVRRIIMNLLGNALKYTDVGFVKVSIDQIDRQTDDRSSSKHLVLKVVDSGRGIDPDFLQNRAFKPFSQEDALSQGTGLGLSLVREIVQALGGSLHIESQLRCGTSVTVELPMQLSEDVQPPSPVWRHVIALKGLRAVLRGFHAEAGVRGIPGSTPPAELAIITAICRDWLHLDIVPADAVDIRPYIVICTKKSAERLVAASVQSSPPVVVVCESIITAHEFVQRHVKGYRGRIFETIPQP